MVLQEVPDLFLGSWAAPDRAARQDENQTKTVHRKRFAKNVDAALFRRPQRPANVPG
jgi:hypothetical protein